MSISCSRKSVARSMWVDRLSGVNIQHGRLYRVDISSNDTGNPWQGGRSSHVSRKEVVCASLRMLLERLFVLLASESKKILGSSRSNVTSSKRSLG